MTSSALNDWNINPDPETIDYHARQWEKIYGSTMEFGKFIKPFVLEDTTVLDLGCGAGSSTVYLAETYQATKFTGVDISEVLIQTAKTHCGPIKNCWFSKGDICNLPTRTDVDGVISLQTFSWMPDIETPLQEICTKINPKWMAFSSLFYKGDISCQIIVDEPKRPRKSYYNVYSTPRTGAFLKQYGYELVDYWRFQPKDDLPKPDNLDLMKTYTERNRVGFRNQFSGPLYLPWYFLCFEKMT